MFLYTDGNGATHSINGKSDMIKAMGASEGKLLMMTDESGQLVGLGNGASGMARSMPIIEAVREQQTMAKSMPTPAPKVLLKKPMLKSQGSFNLVLAELESLQKSMRSQRLGLA